MLLFQPCFRYPTKAAKPPNLSQAEDISPGVTPLVGDPADLAVDVETPSGQTLAIDDPDLIRTLGEGLGDEHSLTLLRADRAMTDCRPISLFSVQTGDQLGDEIGTVIDKRRFRANIYMDLGTAGGFTEDEFVGRQLQIGSKVVVSILERDPRCVMITLDPDTAKSNPEVLRKVARAHEGMAGIYGAVLIEGMVQQGDAIELLN